MGDESPSRLVAPAMSRSACPICGHANPADARFCNACGAPLYLAPCPRCGAMNDRAATQCHECGTAQTNRWAGSAPMPSARSEGAPPAGAAVDRPLADAADPQEALRELRRLMTPPLAEKERTNRWTEGAPGRSAAPDAGAALPTNAPAAIADAGTRATQELPERPSTSQRRRPSVWFAAMAVLVIAALAVYYAYRQQPATGSAPSTAAVGEAKVRSGEAGGAPAAKVEGEPRSTPPSASPPAPPAPSTAGAENIQPVAPDAQRAAAPGAADKKLTAGSAKDPQGDAARQAIPPPAPASRATEIPRAVTRAAPRPSESNPAEAILIPPPQIPGAGSKIEPPPARLGPCTEALAALGLCNPEPVQRRE